MESNIVYFGERQWGARIVVGRLKPRAEKLGLVLREVSSKQYHGNVCLHFSVEGDGAEEFVQTQLEDKELDGVSKECSECKKWEGQKQTASPIAKLLSETDRVLTARERAITRWRSVHMAIDVWPHGG